MKQLWKKFDKLTEICYMSELDDECPEWDEAYEVFKERMLFRRGLYKIIAG